MLEVALDRYYKIVGRNTVFLAVRLEAGVALKNLNRSAIWQTVYNQLVGYFEGYLVQDNRLVFVSYDIIGGLWQQRVIDTYHDVLSLDLVEPCGLRTEVIKMSEWRPIVNDA